MCNTDITLNTSSSENPYTSIPILNPTWRIRATTGFIFQWLREVLRGALDGEVALHLPACFRCNVRIITENQFRATVSVPPGGGLHLRCDPTPSPALSVRVVADTFESLDNPHLTDALLGTSGVEGGWRLLLEDPSSLDRRRSSLRRHLEESLSEDDSSYSPERLRELVRGCLNFRDGLLQNARTALENRISTELAGLLTFSDPETPLFEVTFSPSPAGKELYDRVIHGDLAALQSASPAEVTWHSDRLLTPAADKLLQLQMPFLERREYRTRLQSYGKMDVQAGADGSLRVFLGDDTERIERFNTAQTTLIFSSLAGREQANDSGSTISFIDKRKLSIAQARQALPRIVTHYGLGERVTEWLSGLKPSHAAIEANFHLSIPSELASVWLESPPVRNQDFTDSFSDVAQMVQKSLRAWLPYLYFHDMERYGNLGTTRSLLVYEACRPAARKKRPEFTYDVMNPASVALAFKKSSGALPDILRAVSQLLIDSGKPAIARSFQPKYARDILDSVRRGYRLFTGLLAADAQFMDCFVMLASRCRELKLQMEANPDELAKSHRPALEVVETIHSKLRRLYDRQSFVSLGSLLFLEATRALHAVEEALPPVKAVLRIRIPGDPAAPEHVFVNDAWRQQI